VLSDVGWRWKIVPPLIEDVRHGRDFRSYEDINAKNCLQVGTVSEIVKNRLVKECEDGCFPLILGGDHCISIGTVSALKTLKKNSAIIWVDAHADINTPTTSLSGNMHGMPVAFLLGLVDKFKELPGFSWFEPTVVPQDIVYIGLRDLDRAEKVTIKKLGIKAFTVNIEKFPICLELQKNNFRPFDRCMISIAWESGK
jgi:arginase